ncbi:putative inner membrane transporter YedA [Ruegeria meonggei]|uniref:Putative inner membrane transporter YedA n=2 Tax=Ruegeria meonggei TaxID=1446476 RepID=A0A1X6YWF8_9RHOB|nr:putative inner membrane transporter YedA [Ruegeria meonggei]
MRMMVVDWGLLGFLSILWGGTFFFTSIAVGELPPLTVVFLRVSIAALALFIYLGMRGNTLPRNRQVWKAFLTMGFLNNVVPFSLFFWAQTTIPGGLASIANAATPVFSITVAHFMLADEKFTANKFFGVVLALIGVGFLFGKEVSSGASVATLGLLACLTAALCQGFSVVYGRRFNALGLSSSVSALGQLVATTVIMLPVILLVDHPWALATPSIAAVGSIAGMALFSTALAYMIFFHLLATAGAVNASLVTLLIPVSAILLGTGFLGEVLATTHFVGLALISCGLLVIDGRVLQVGRA